MSAPQPDVQQCGDLLRAPRLLLQALVDDSYKIALRVRSPHLVEQHSVFLWRLPVEQEAPGRHREREDAESEDVGLDGGLPREWKLGRHVAERAVHDGGLRDPVVVNQGGVAEVPEVRVGCHVARFHAAVQDTLLPLLVQVRQLRANADEDVVSRIKP